MSGPGRVTAVIEFLAARSTETFTLSELARRVGLNKSTAHAVMTTLYEAGWVFRSPHDLRYGLGPRLTSIGAAAAGAIPELRVAQPVMQRLAGELSAECVFSSLVEDEIVILGTTGAVALDAPRIVAGSRVPCTPPLGTVFVAWFSESERTERRLRGFDRGYDAMDDELAAIRRRGYVATLAAGGESWLRALGELPASAFARTQRLRELEDQLAAVAAASYLAAHGRSAGQQDVDALVAPVFEGSSVRHALTASRLGRRLDPQQLAATGARVRAAADEISRALGELDHRRTAPMQAHDSPVQQEARHGCPR